MATLFYFNYIVYFCSDKPNTKGDYYENNGRDATEYFK